MTFVFHDCSRTQGSKNNAIHLAKDLVVALKIIGKVLEEAGELDMNHRRQKRQLHLLSKTFRVLKSLRINLLGKQLESMEVSRCLL